MDRISDLPKEILHRILYLLSQEEAVRTSVLSKSWRYIWCTRPNLAFSDQTFKGKKQNFPSVVEETLQLYCDRDQRLCLEEFHLSISLLDHELVSLLEKWIPLLTNMGVKDFHLSIVAKPSFHGIINLPVVFKAEPLKLLNLYKCNLGQNIPENIPFVRLQVLSLFKVSIENELFDKIISSCPLLAEMFFQNCKGLKTIKLEKKLHKYLKHFTFINRGTYPTDECSIEIDVPSLETIKITSSKIRLPSHTKFINLKSLSLKKVEISSDSIEQSQLLCIDAPNIEYFEYKGDFIPSISFAPTCGKSNLKLYIRDVDDAQSWFLRLSKLLQALRRSGISLFIVHCLWNNVHIEEDILVQDIIDGGNRPVAVENLLFRFVDISSYSFLSFVHSLFCICRPININIPPRQFLLRLEKESELKELGIFFGKIQKIRESGNQETCQYLEDLTIEGFDVSRQEWQPLQVSKLSESALLRIRFYRVRSKWSDQDCESNSKLSKS